MSHPVVRTERNPMDWALDLLGMTRKEFETYSGLGKSYLLRVSQGRHSNMGEKVYGSLHRLAKEKGIDLDGEILGRYGAATTLDEAWDIWVHRHRKQQKMPQPVADPDLNPFMRLVKAAGGVARMSALLAAPDTLVERYAKGVSYQMPMPIMMALVDLDYPHIKELDKAMRHWGETNA